MKDSNRVAIALITNSKDDILMGFRQKEEAWHLPSGKIHIAECPFFGMKRELKEETGLDAKSIELVKLQFKEKLLLYLFKVTIDSEQEIDVSKDPDQEFSKVEFKDPNDIKDNLYIDIQDNIALKYWINN